MFGLGMGELVVIFFIILLLFGAKNLPEMAKSLGKSVRDFKRATNDIKSGLEYEMNQPEQAAVKKPEIAELKKLEPAVASASAVNTAEKAA